MSNHSAAICHRMFQSPTLKSSGGHFGAKFGEEEVDRKPNFNTIWVRHGTVVCKGNRVDIFCRRSIMHERDRQTNTLTLERHRYQYAKSFTAMLPHNLTNNLLFHVLSDVIFYYTFYI